MAQFQAFIPQGNTVTFSATTTSSNAQVVPAGPQAQSVRVVNSGSVIVYLAFGQTSAVTANNTSIPMLGNSVEVFALPNASTYMAVNASSATATVYVTAGEGM